MFVSETEAMSGAGFLRWSGIVDEPVIESSPTENRRVGQVVRYSPDSSDIHTGMQDVGRAFSIGIILGSEEFAEELIMLTDEGFWVIRTDNHPTLEKREHRKPGHQAIEVPTRRELSVAV